MRIKQFEAQNMREALRMIKEDFGPEAVIVSVKNVKKTGGLFGLSSSSGVVVVAALDSPSVVSEAPETISSQKAEGHSSRGYAGGYGLYQGKATGYPSGPPSVRPLKSSGQRGGTVSPMRPRNRKDLYVLYHQLLAQGVQESLALRLVSEVQNQDFSSLPGGKEEISRHIGRALGAMGIGHRRLKMRRGEQQIVVFAGPTGVGKTTTLAKFAAFAQSSRLRGRMGWLSLDAYKVGSLAQARVYEAIMGVPVELVSNEKDFRDALGRFREKDLIFVDTPGIGPRDEERISMVQSVLTGQVSMEVYLLISAATRNPEMGEIVERFSVLPVTSLLFTKTDESRSFGALLNTLFLTKLPLSYFTCGQGVPDDIEIATPEKLMRLLLAEDAVQKVWSGPPEVLAEKVSLFEDLLIGTQREERAGGLQGRTGFPSDGPLGRTPYATGFAAYQ